MLKRCEQAIGNYLMRLLGRNHGWRRPSAYQVLSGCRLLQGTEVTDLAPLVSVALGLFYASLGWARRMRVVVVVNVVLGALGAAEAAGESACNSVAMCMLAGSSPGLRRGSEDDLLIWRVEHPRAVYMRRHVSAASQEGSSAGNSRCTGRRGVWLSRHAVHCMDAHPLLWPCAP
jgi:hypothetical protein